ncbi:damage-inducible protein DinB [Bosea sp. F3-2]|uniref:DinB family protein n=1 Tax=Bosea sp. F3-2 TaxID=2599640 RepID=UPI0011EC2E3D|nr:DinB family protein [Bosea sp. F3-2]QEL25647.1 damage-inducible protein DinB [Bosea sp. F3-2]
MTATLRTLYGYQAWANKDLLGKLGLLDPKSQGEALRTALRLISHYHVVAEIFAGHLTGEGHRHAADNTAETPTLQELGASVAATDRWYQNYVRTAAREELSESITFTFTDGDRGCMTREEMLMHVALHSAVHRGEVCRILSQLAITPPWDTLAVYLHQVEPFRREVKQEPASMPA